MNTHPGADIRSIALLDQLAAGTGLRAVFQPIVRLDDMSVVAHEGLCRPAGGSEGRSVLDLLDLGFGEQRNEKPG